MQQGTTTRAQVTVIGVGGGGIQAVNALVEAGIEGVKVIAADTHLDTLNASRAPTRLQLGPALVKGLSTGANPEWGKRAALEVIAQVRDVLRGARLVVVAAGLGGGTGTGAAPVIAGAAKEHGALTLAVVTTPFGFEGKRRLAQAQGGLRELRAHTDALLTLPNDRLLGTVGEAMPLSEALGRSGDVLRRVVEALVEVLAAPGPGRLDFQSVAAVLEDMGRAFIGTGMARGEGRAVEAARRATADALLEASSMAGARGVLLQVTGGPDLTLAEVHEAVCVVKDAADADASLVFSSAIEERMRGQVRVTVVATGM